MIPLTSEPEASVESDSFATRGARRIFEPGEIHVWQASLDDAANPDDWEILADDERERAERYRFERDRIRYVTGRALLRKILGDYLECDPASLVFATGPYGKPRIVQPAGDETLHFNVSHSEGVALYAVSREGPVGVDVERVREIADWAEIAGTVFPPEEQARLHALPAEWRVRGFVEAWTRQEAFLKATGDGFGADNPGACAQQAGYSLHALAPAPGYVATLASAVEASRVVFSDWPDSPAATSEL